MEKGEINSRHGLLHGVQACSSQLLQVAVSNSMMMHACVISFLDLQVLVSNSPVVHMCVKSSLDFCSKVMSGLTYRCVKSKSETTTF